MENESNKKQYRALVIVFSLLMVLTLLVGALPLTAAAQACKFRYTVQPGDTITYVANLYQIAWEKIAEANDLRAPYTIIVGTVLCIPGGQSPDGTPAATSGTPAAGKKGAQASLTISPGFNSVYVSVENFLPKTSYYVRVFPRTTGVSYRIGNFTTNKEGDFADWFRLPAYVPRTLDMGVCVKNVWTDAVSCVKYADDVVAPFIEALGRIRCAKEGR